MEFVKTKIKAKIYGQEFELRKPSFDEREKFGADMDAALKADQTKEILKIQKEFLACMGLPIDFIGGMEADHVDQLSLELIGKKKD